MRSFTIVANWKMNGDLESLNRLLRELNDVLGASNRDLILAPAYVHLPLVRKELKIKNAVLAAQNCSKYSNGAFTGEISARMLVDLGCDWVILGHSERRQNFGETNDIVASKIRAAVSAGLGVILCVGETLAQRDSGDEQSIVYEQMMSLDGSINDDSKIMIAYEPVWAIGTNKIPNNIEVKKNIIYIKKLCRNRLGKNYIPRVLYGGSVNDGNIKLFSKLSDIDGFLIGGASQSSKKFIDIIKNYYK